ncbi:protein kinase [Streptomyces sp. NPDC049687]|uniref:protein kinase domain-containing protein n=1 Tax=Streptomyces sp. NPDC049687 TaxID=3365596 RepID=UPI0037ABC2E5
MSDVGRLIAGRYRVLDRIGRGGMATVWRAHDNLLGREVAVKKLHAQPQLDDDELATLFERARREARSAARISHPNVVVVHDVVDDEGLPSIVMEYVPSTTLADLIEAHGPVPLEEVSRIGRGVIAALRAAHQAGILHRDVKPANVLIAEDGRVVLTDFGIAQAVETSHLTRTGQLVGSVDFIAPERLVGARPGPEADLWGLGATLFQAVDGRSPFLRDSVTETMYAIAMEPVPEVHGAGPLTPLIQGLLAANPAERLSSEDAERLLRPPVGETGSFVGSSVAPPAVAAITDDAPPPATQLEAGTRAAPASESEPASTMKSESGRNPGHGTDEPSAAGNPSEGPQPATTDLQAHRPSGRSKKPVLIAAAAAAAVLITIAWLVTPMTEKGGRSATASDGPLPAGDTTHQSTSAPAASSPVSSRSASTGVTPPTPLTPSQSQSKATQKAPEPESEGENPSKESGSDTVAPAGRALVVAASGKCLSSGDGTEGMQLFPATCDGSAAQQWRTGSDGTMRSSGKCMTVAGGATADRTEIRLAGCVGNSGQKFRLVGTKLMADQSRKCVDIFGGASGTGAVLWECNGRDNQVWTLR